MRKILFVLVAMVFMAGLAIPVSAQAPSAYESTVNITNITDSAGSITLTYYNSDGSVAATYGDTIAALETKFYTTLPAVSAGFDGSMIISSSVELASSSMVIGKDGSDNAMNYANYIGVSSGSDTVYLPLLMDSNYGFSTYFYIQNTGTSATDVTITYGDGLSVPPVTNLQPGASVKIDNLAEAHVSKKFSAELTTTGSIAVAVVEFGDDSLGFGKPLLAYNGFSSGPTNPVIPMVNQNNYGYWTAIPIQNLGGTDTTVTLTYNPTKAGTSCTETLTIPAGGSAEFGSYAHVFTPQTPGTTCVLGEQFVGNAIVTQNSANQPLVGIMNQSSTIDPTLDKAGALMTLNINDATAKIAFPEVYQWYGADTWWSSITITNVSGGTLPIGDITCRGIGSAGGTPEDQTWSNTAAIADGEGWITDLWQGWGPFSDGFLGGVTCESASGGELLGILNNLGFSATATIDSLGVYEGINIAVTP